MRGFLLVDSLLAISILTLLSALVLPGWQRQQQTLALEQASRTLLAFLTQTQTSAAQLQQTLSVQRERTNEGGWCFWVSGLSGQADCHNAPLVWQLTDRRVQLLTTPSFPSPKFYGNTGASQATRITLIADNYRIRVVLSSKGRLSRCSEGGHIGPLRSCR